MRFMQDALHTGCGSIAAHAGNGTDESRLQVRSLIKRAQRVYSTFSSSPQCCFFAGTEHMHNPMRNNVPELGTGKPAVQNLQSTSSTIQVIA